MLITVNRLQRMDAYGHLVNLARKEKERKKKRGK